MRNFTSCLRGLFQRRPAVRRPASFRPTFEVLEERAVPTVTASFSTTLARLDVQGDTADNSIRVDADAQGVLSVTNNGQAVAISGGSATLTNTNLIRVFGDSANDTISVSDNVFRTATFTTPGIQTELHGGLGRDTLIGGRGADSLFGEDNDDTLKTILGQGPDTLDAGLGGDTVVIDHPTAAPTGLITPTGNPPVNIRQEADGNRLLVERYSLNGGARVMINLAERLQFNAGAGDDTIQVYDLAGVTNIKSLVINGGDGNDTIDASEQTDVWIDTVTHGGAGNDTIRGGDGNDKLYGDDGRDELYGNNGSDRLDGGNDGFADWLRGGAGADTFVQYYTAVPVPGGALLRFYEEFVVAFVAAEGDVLVEIQK